MMTQWLIIGIVVCAAVIYLVRYAWRAWRGQGGCGCGCGECPAKHGKRTPLDGHP